MMGRIARLDDVDQAPADAIRTVAAARAVADFLDGIGEHKRAQDVRRVCTSNSSYRGILKQFHRDNKAMREALKFYADPAHWPDGRAVDATTPLALIDSGMQARKVLAS